MRFLAVDDDPLFLQLLTLRMQALGYADLITVTSGAAALTLLQSAPNTVDCILSDVRMPEMDGITLCRNIRTLPAYATTPIVMITSMSDRSYIDEAFEAGATDYINKPLDRLELKARIGMVAQLWAKGQQRVDAPLSSYAVEPAHDFEDALVLPNVERLISHLAMENYLLTLGLKRMHSLRAFAVQVENARVFFSAGNPTAFVDMLGDVACAVLDSLKTEDVLFSYAGSGVFVCIARSDLGSESEDLGHSANRNLAAFEDLYHADGLPLPKLVFGATVRSSAFTLTRPTKLPEMAVAALMKDHYKAPKTRARMF
ncbi:MAG: response regulator [Pseudomonadota bacterium]